MSFQKVRLTQMAGVRADQPAATMVAEGTLYFVTDEAVVDRSNGTTWDEVLNVAAALAAFTPTAVPFADGAGALTEDPTKFAYDNTNDQLFVPTMVGGTGVDDDLTLKATNGAGTINSRIFLKVGNNGSQTAMEVLQGAGNWGRVGINTPGVMGVDGILTVTGSGDDIGYLIIARSHVAQPSAYIAVQGGFGDADAEAGFSFYQLENNVEWRMGVYGNDANAMIWKLATSSLNMMFFTVRGNMVLSDERDEPVTTGRRCHVMRSDEAPTGMVDDTSAIYTKDDAGGTAQLFGINENDQVTQLTGISNTYTPTRSAEANLDANVTPSVAQYVRTGDLVTVSGRFTADPTAPGAASFELSLPIASAIAAVEDCAGVAFCGAIAGQGAAISGSVANNTAVFSWVAVDTTSQAWSYSYSYRVI